MICNGFPHLPLNSAVKVTAAATNTNDLTEMQCFDEGVEGRARPLHLHIPSRNTRCAQALRMLNIKPFDGGKYLRFQ